VTRSDVLVIGAGMAGVTAARALTRAGLRVLVLEARHRLGGRIHTVREFCAAPVEAGAELIHGTAAKTWPEVKAAGLRVRPSPHERGAMMNLGDGARWFPAALINPQVWPAFTILRRIAHAASERNDLSAAEFIKRQGYRGHARTLAEMVLSSHLPGSLDDIGVQGFVADGVLRLETGSDYRIDDGYDRLVEHIAHSINIEYGFEVSSIQWSSDGVEVGSTDGRYVEARAAVVTLPVGVLKSGAIRFSPSLPEDKDLALKGIIMGPVVKVLLLFEEPFWPRRLSALLCGIGPVTLYWNVFYASSLEAPVLCAYCTGSRAVALSRISEEEAVDRIIGDLRKNFPKATLRLAAWRLIDWSKDPFARGGYSFLRPDAVGARRQLAAASTGKLFWAGSETATMPIAATVEGAFTSGLRAAEDVLEAFE
jgi:monoamine oxidase